MSIDIGNIVREDTYEYKMIDRGDWVDHGKYSFLEGMIVQHVASGMFYEVTGVSRYGSHWEGYELDFDEAGLVEVEKREIIVTKWLPINKEE